MCIRKVIQALLISTLFSGVFSLTAVAQSLISGDVTGIVSDQSGAIVPNSNVTIKNNGTGQT